MNLDEVLHHRRSVRVYDKEKPIDTEKVKHCLELATDVYKRQGDNYVLNAAILKLE